MTNLVSQALLDIGSGNDIQGEPGIFVNRVVTASFLVRLGRGNDWNASRGKAHHNNTC